MLVRKKTKIRIAYAVLTLTTLAALAHDAQLRSTLPRATAAAMRAAQQEPVVPLALTPLAKSPFPEARPRHVSADTGRIAEAEPIAGQRRRRTTSTAGAYFLTVAVHVDCGKGPITYDRGSRVRLVREQDGKLLVSMSGTEFLIEKSHVTDDVRTLPALARNSS